MTRRLLQDNNLSSSNSTSTLPTTPSDTTVVDDMHTHRMGSVLEERRDPNFNSWTEIIPERVRHAAKG